jgi:hypothetical protein
MKPFDHVVCDYPLPELGDHDREFLTRDFGGFGVERYTITRDGRLLRHAHAEPHGLAPVKDVEWPIHGELRIFDDEETTDGETRLEYAVRFAGGRVEWVRRVRLDLPQVRPTSSLPPGAATMVPQAMGRPASPEEFRAAVPHKLELVDGRIPGAEKLVLMLLVTMGLRRVAALVGRDAWLAAAEGLDERP